MLIPSIPVSAGDLWGNLAGDDEEIEVLDHCFVDKAELFGTFRSSSVPLRIVRSRKGMGKSALLRKVAHEKRGSSQDLVIELSGSDLVFHTRALDDPEDLIHCWKQMVARRIFMELGSEIGVALSDDEITAVELAQLEGRRQSSLIQILLDHFAMSVGATGLTVSPQRPDLRGDVAARVARLQQDAARKMVWLFVDDIDSTYIGTDRQRLKISTFFSACRSLSTSIPGLCIRASVRSDVWVDIEKENDALDKVLQYVADLEWSEEELRQILAERVRGYCTRHGIVLDPLRTQRTCRGDREVLRLVFTDPWRTPSDMRRNGAAMPPHRWIYELSYGRPRWAAHLCSLAGAVATRQGPRKIGRRQVACVLEEFGKARVDDLVREHGHECPEVAELIQAFVGQPATMTTVDLMVTIHNRILEHRRPTIDGKVVHSPVPLAHFLYRIGFLVAVFVRGNTEVRHLFDTHPDLLSARTNLDEGARWEIHHCFRRHLRISDVPLA
jgi:hypothetical protein